MTISSFAALHGADSLGTSAAYVVVVKILTNVKIIIALIVIVASTQVFADDSFTDLSDTLNNTDKNNTTLSFI